jgi:hypothetical protein
MHVDRSVDEHSLRRQRGARGAQIVRAAAGRGAAVQENVDF